jgi:hypothetical protein
MFYIVRDSGIDRSLSFFPYRHCARGKGHVVFRRNSYTSVFHQSYLSFIVKIQELLHTVDTDSVFHLKCF